MSSCASDGVQQNSKDILEGEDASDLYFYYIQCELDPDPFGKMIELYSENGISKTRHEVRFKTTADE